MNITSYTGYPNTISYDFKDFMEKCLMIDPGKRPKVSELLEHNFCKFINTSQANKEDNKEVNKAFAISIILLNLS